jgi:hypothetical protein
VTTPAKTFYTMNNHQFQLDTTGGTATPIWATLASGIKNVSIANNEKLVQDSYLDGNGFGSSDVIAAQLVLTFSADRDFGDAAQNYIFGKLLSLGTNRHTKFKWTLPDAGVYTGDCTIANISGPTGDAGAKGELKFEVHFNGQPTFTAGP